MSAPVLNSNDPRVRPLREPVFNIPAVVACLALIMVALEGVRELVLSPDADLMLLAWFAFVPARYLSPDLLPGGMGAQLWTFVTYAFLHGNWVHLVVNLVWLLAFASPLAWRFGVPRFLAFFAVTAAAGALAHLVTHLESISPMMGASAVVSGAMAGSARFAFAPGGPLGPRIASRFGGAPGQPGAVPLKQVLSDRRVLVFLGAWAVLNILSGVGGFGADGDEIAWQAHFGGFAAGLLLFPLFDPVPRALSPRR